MDSRIGAFFLGFLTLAVIALLALCNALAFRALGWWGIAVPLATIALAYAVGRFFGGDRW